LSIAERLNYRPMRAARSLSSGKSWTITVINPVPDSNLTSGFYSRFLHGIHDVAKARHYTVALTVLDDETEALGTLERLILERGSDGVVLMNPSDNPALLEKLKARVFPHVLLGRHPQEEGLSVDNDNEAVAFDATRHLLERERGPVLFLSGPTRHTFTQDRWQGYRRALAETAFSPLAAEGDGSAETAKEQVAALLAHGTPFRSVLALSDAIALGAMRAVRERGLRVPEDVAVMGMNNDDLTRYTDPPLSSVELNAYRLGEKAATLLLAHLTGMLPAERRHIVPHALVVRASS
jgi:DNA-binding LacI/PurR family transcriptional regulator